eukprot:Nk52_evm47s2367 gene=Nk52_evmTU47s2367
MDDGSDCWPMLTEHDDSRRQSRVSKGLSESSTASNSSWTGWGNGTGISKEHWADDNDVDGCMARNCDLKFGLLRRRHHCRRCGKIFCAKHSNFVLPLNENAEVDLDDGTPVRVCFMCHKFKGNRGILEYDLEKEALRRYENTGENAASFYGGNAEALLKKFQEHIANNVTSAAAASTDPCSTSFESEYESASYGSQEGSADAKKVFLANRGFISGNDHALEGEAALAAEAQASSKNTLSVLSSKPYDSARRKVSTQWDWSTF